MEAKRECKRVCYVEIRRRNAAQRNETQHSTPLQWTSLWKYFLRKLVPSISTFAVGFTLVTVKEGSVVFLLFADSD